MADKRVSSLMTSYKAFKAIFWKNLTLIKRQWTAVLVMEMLIPILFFGMLSFGATHLHRKPDKDFINVTSIPRKTTNMDVLTSFLPSKEDWIIWHAPTSGIFPDIMQYVAKELKLTEENPLNFETNQELFSHVEENYQNKDLYAVTFQNQIDEYLSYNLTINKNYLEWKTRELYRSGPDNNNYNPYLHEGYLALQIFINKAFINTMFKIEDISNVWITLEEISPIDNQGIAEREHFLLTILPLSMIFSFGLIVILSNQKRMWHDESFGMNDLLRISGVGMHIILFGWHIFMMILSLVPIGLSTLFLKAEFWGFYLLHNCHWGVLFAFLFLYNMAAVSDYLFIACASHKSSVNHFILLVLWLLYYFLPNMILPVENWSYLWQIVSSTCLSNIALKFGCIALTEHKSTETTLDFGNLFQLNSSIEKGYQGHLSMGYVFLFLIINIIIKFFCSMFIVDLFKRDRQTLNMCFQTIRTKLCGNASSTSDNNEEQIELLENSDKKPFVTINGLIKKYGVRTVLNIPRLYLYEGKITAILGTNGAGKSTLISILTGIIRSYSGSVVFSKGEKNPKMGFCLQENVFFEDLTVWENLLFFAKLRGAESPANEVNEILKEMDLSIKRDNKICTLSSGHKRKLCLGMALIGKPKILILDEPTGDLINETATGRHIIRNVIEKRSKDMTILLTTHNWEEAEFLSDNIMIMHEGNIVVQSTPLNNLRKNNEYFITLLLSDLSRLDEIERYITTNFPTLRILQRVGKKIVLHSPYDDFECHKHIDHLTNFKNELSIDTISYNASILRDLFVKNLNETKNSATNVGTTENLEQFKTKIVSDLSKYYSERHYGYKMSILLKKLWYFILKPHWYIPGVLVMGLLITIALVSMSAGRYYYVYNEPSVDLESTLYNNTQIFISGLSNIVIHDQSEQVHFIDSSDVVEEIYRRIKNGTLLSHETNIMGANFKMDENNSRISGVNIVYTSSALHSAPIAVNFAMNTILNNFLNTTNQTYMKTKNVPINIRKHSDYIIEGFKNDGIILWAILISLGLILWSTTFVIFAGIEIATKFLQLQTTSFIRMVWYWNFYLLSDSLIALLHIGIILLYILLFDNVFCSDPILSSQEYLILFTILLVYTISVLPFSYMCAFATKFIHEASHQFILFGIAFGILSVLPYTIVFTEDPGPFTFYSISKAILNLLLPQFALSYNLFQVGTKFMDNHNWDNMNSLEKHFLCRKLSANPCCIAESAECYQHRSYFNNDRFGIKNNLVYSIGTFIIWQCLFISSYSIAGKKNKIFRFSKYFRRNDRSYTSRHDAVLSQHDNQSNNILQNGLCLKTDNLQFYCANTVNNLKFQFLPNSVYGIHGANGTGKSLLFSILGKRKFSFNGEIYLGRLDPEINKRISIKDGRYFKEFGYFSNERENLHHCLTARELLIMASISRGYNLKMSSKAADLLLKTFALPNRKCSQLSGGNRKILRICAAFVGFPNFVMIDDIRRNLDLPVRKILWDFCLAFKEYTKKTVIMSLERKGKYTSLCDGFLDLDGGRQQPSSKREICTITFRMNPIPQSNLETCKSIINGHFKGEIEETNSCDRFLRIGVPRKYPSDNGKYIETIFKNAEFLKQHYSAVIEDYEIEII